MLIRKQYNIFVGNSFINTQTVIWIIKKNEFLIIYLHICDICGRAANLQ